MNALNALTVAIEAAVRKRDEARRVLQDAQAAQQGARAQLDQIEGYARETEARWGVKADAAMKPEVLYHHYQFMGRLGHAVGIQAGVVDHHSQRVEAARQALLQAELRLASLRRLVDKRRQELERAEMRRDQKQTDERAALQYRSAGQEH
ncbi:MAG: flagellar export protein FliJ [Acidovorax sp.]|uniref:flagellar export protein FliJ n=1 Tax=Acidovorax sp. TaxID=1872122 RepID=UPI0039E25C0B